MKNIIQQFSVIVLLLFFTVSCMAQQNNFGKIGISYSSFGTNDLIYFEGLDGAPTYNSNNFFVFGFNYLYPLNNWLEFETCIEYAKHRITVEPNLPPGYNSSPYTDDFSLLEIPLGIRINFLQFFFLNTGIFVDMNVSQSSSVYSQSGIGVMGGIAAKYDFKFRLSVFVNPYIKAHSLIAFEKDNHQLHLMETGFRFGITYTLIKNKER